MANWGTIKQDILETIDKPNDSSLVERSLCETLRFLRTVRFWWNESTFKIYTTANLGEYDLPQDFLGFIGKVFHKEITVSGDTTTEGAKRELVPRTMDWLEAYRYTNEEWDASLAAGRPLFYSLSESKLWLSPIPDSDGDEVSARYLRDLGTPQEVYSGSAWSVYAPNTETAIASTFSHAWFKEGYDILKHRCCYNLYQDIYKDQENAQAHLQKFLEAMDRVRSETSRRKAARELRAIW